MNIFLLLKRSLLMVMFFSFLPSYAEISSKGDQTIILFDKTHLYFDMALKSKKFDKHSPIHRLDAGRVLLKKVKLPSYDLVTNIHIEMSLTSNGDPWDKSGSVFVIPKNTEVSLLNFENGTFDLKQLNEKYPAVTPFQKKGMHYLPSIELLRFMTPFGVGHFSQSKQANNIKPIYIPRWEDKVEWVQDITHLAPLLEDEVYIGVYIDTWTKEGYHVSVTLHFDESDFIGHKKRKRHILPLVNTVKYASDQSHYDAFSEKPIEVDFTLHKKVKDLKLHYIVTGHGGHGLGDEFTKKENIIHINNKVIKRFTPWRDDCASFRRFNPSSGVWLRNVKWNGKDFKERIASSDLSRSNWCPGSDVVPEEMSLHLKPGKHHLKIEIPEAQVAKENENNYWMVSAYISFYE